MSNDAVATIKVSNIKPLTGRWILPTQKSVGTATMLVVVDGIQQSVNRFMKGGERTTEQDGYTFVTSVINENQYAIKVEVYEC